MAASTARVHSQEVALAKKRSMVDELHIGKVDDGELELVSTSVLPRVAKFRPAEVEYRIMADEWTLSLQELASTIRGERALGRDRKPQDLVGTVLFLVDLWCSAITSQIIVVNRGGIMP
jgi:NAD(P)-dependent dehydrogenase (short-subunit alcohol dehydrogenase family)